MLGISKATTGVQRFMSNRWEYSEATMGRTSGCAKEKKCSYKHYPDKHKCFRNIHEPTRVRNKPSKSDQTKKMILDTCNREHGQLVSTRRRENGGKKPMGRKQARNGGHQGKARRGLEQGGSKNQEGGG